MTTNQDVARDILFTAYDELLGRGILSSFEISELRDILSDFCDCSVEEREVTASQFITHENRFCRWDWREKII